MRVEDIYNLESASLLSASEQKRDICMNYFSGSLMSDNNEAAHVRAMTYVRPALRRGAGKAATWELSRYKKYSERVRSSPTGRVCRIYGGRARQRVKTTLMPCPVLVNTNDYPRIARNTAYSVNAVQNPRHCPAGIDIRGLTEYKCAKPQLIEHGATNVSFIKARRYPWPLDRSVSHEELYGKFNVARNITHLRS